MKLSVIIPVYNEEKTVKEIINKVKSVNLDIEKEIIIVDDSSKDSTRDILKKIKDDSIKVYYHEKNKGKGAAVRTGLNNSSGEIIVIQDADLEYNPKEYPLLLDPILNGKEKVVYGSRFKGRILGDLILSHYYGNKLLTLVTRILYLHGVSDMETCYKMFRREVLDGINLKAKRFDFEPEITAKIIKKGYNIYEVPITYHMRSFKEGKKIHWTDGIKALYYLVKYRFVN